MCRLNWRCRGETLIDSEPGMKKCPLCNETISTEALRKKEEQEAESLRRKEETKLKCIRMIHYIGGEYVPPWHFRVGVDQAVIIPNIQDQLFPPFCTSGFAGCVGVWGLGQNAGFILHLSSEHLKGNP